MSALTSDLCCIIHATAELSVLKVRSHGRRPPSSRQCAKASNTHRPTVEHIVT